MRRWGSMPLAVYVSGILLPVLCVVGRVDLMPAMGVPGYTVLFWTGPFTSAAAVVWSEWSVGWRAVWMLLVPVFIAIILAVLVMPTF